MGDPIIVAIEGFGIESEEEIVEQAGRAHFQAEAVERIAIAEQHEIYRAGKTIVGEVRIVWYNVGRQIDVSLQGLGAICGYIEGLQVMIVNGNGGGNGVTTRSIYQHGGQCKGDKYALLAALGAYYAHIVILIAIEGEGYVFIEFMTSIVPGNMHIALPELWHLLRVEYLIPIIAMAALHNVEVRRLCQAF